MSGTARKSRLAGAMKQKVTADASDTPDSALEGAGEPEGARSLALAPPPAEEPETAPAETPEAAEQPEAVEDPVPAAPPVAEERPEPEQRTVAEERPEPAPAPADPSVKSHRSRTGGGQTARVLAGSRPVDLGGRSVEHLLAVMEGGRDQREYVKGLPRRSDKGTYMRLPVHLQDALAEYCDRDEAPMADFVAAVLDGYFRDIGLLPPMGEGHRPNEKFLDKIRKQSRTYDY